MYVFDRGGDPVHLRAARGGGAHGAVRRRALRRVAARALHARRRHARAAPLPQLSEGTGNRRPRTLGPTQLRAF